MDRWRSKSTISRFGESFRDSQYSLVQFLVCCSSTHGASCTQPFVKGGARAPRTPWSQRHSIFIVTVQVLAARFNKPSYAAIDTMCLKNVSRFHFLKISL